MTFGAHLSAEYLLSRFGACGVGGDGGVGGGGSGSPPVFSVYCGMEKLSTG
jgi:hypothetical protein